MRSIRNDTALGSSLAMDFRSLGNALYPELVPGRRVARHHFRSLGNALYPELNQERGSVSGDFRSLGNALYPELQHRQLV